MSTFDERSNAQETKFVLDAGKEFKAEAKRNKALGHWAAGLMGKSDAEADKYALEVIMADMEEAGDDDVFRKLRKDLTAANCDMSDKAIRDRMAMELKAAREEVYGV
ncbi:DUF1476 domain-containing protein [Litorimonas sp. WD9-15]|uniref:DUF1476 domain-containing protein n=1 Tax=Litorimonas sp. WD9-15 TaxID=3418716 RepID=UPI003CFFD497